MGLSHHSRFTLGSLQSELTQAFGTGGRLPDQVVRALGFAFDAHAGQFRDARDESVEAVPYITHPVGVAKTALGLLVHVDLDDKIEDVISACLVHDVLEDNPGVNDIALREATSSRTLEIAKALSKPELVQHGSRSARDAAFVKQIAEAGATAKFVKVCDALHNLSRPGSMPNDLLEKTIRRARHDYMPLARDPKFADSVASALDEAILKAEAFAARGAAIPKHQPCHSFDDAVAYGLARSSTKVLEEHDIAAVIERISGGSLAWVGTPESFIAGPLDLIGSPIEKSLIGEIIARLRAGRFDLDPRLFAAGPTGPRGITHVLVSPFTRAAPGPERFVFVALGHDAPLWLTPKSMMALIALLSERLRSREAKDTAQVATEIAKLGLTLDPELARQHGLGRNELNRMHSFFEAANHVHHRLQSLISRVFGKSASEHFIDRVESRVKQPGSILRKLRASNAVDFSQLDDAVGFRLIVLSRRSASIIEDRLKKAITAINFNEGNDPGNDIVIKSKRIKSVSGYSAIHITFYEKFPWGENNSLIGCEIQIRTIFEDAWARVSHMALYKQKRPQAVEREIKELGDIRSQADDAIDRIS